MTDNTLRIQITAQNGTKAAFDQITQDSQKVSKSLDQMETSGKRSFEGLRAGAVVAGTALGTIAAAFTVAGSAATENQRQLDGLTRLYGDSADQIIKFSDALQANTNFSNEQARQAASTAATLQNSYGLQTEQIEQLIARSADLAQVHGVDLADAVQRTSSAIRGEGESAEALGLTLSDSAVAAQAAARGMTGWNTTMSEAEKAAFRFQLLMEQSTNVQGAAAEAADTTRGKVIDLKDGFQDATVALGNFLGPVGQVAGELAPIALALPAIGAGLGKLAPAATSLLTALGPAGLTAAAGAAAAAFVLLADHTAEWERALESAASATLSLDDAIGRLGASGQNQVAGPLKDVNDSWSELARTGAETMKTLDDISAQITEIDFEMGQLYTGTDEGLAQYNALKAQKEGLIEYREELEKLALSSDQIDAITEDLISLFSKPGINARQASQDIEWYFDQLRQGKIDGQQLVAWIDESANDWTRYSVNVVLATEAQEAFNLALETAVSTMNAQVRPMQVMMDQARAFADNHVLQAERIATSMAQMQRASVAGLPAPERQPVQVTDSRAYDRMVALEGATASMAARQQQSVAALNQGAAAARTYANQLSALEQSVNAVSEAHATFKVTQDTIISSQSEFTGQLSEYQTQLGYLDEAEALLNQRREEGIPLTAQQEDFLNRVDAAQERLQGGTEDATLALGEQALQYAENMKIGDEMNENLSGVSSSVDTLESTIRDLIDALQGVPPDTEANVNGSVYNARELSGDTEALHDALTGLDGYGAEVHISGSVYNASALASSTSDLHSALLALDGTTATTTLNNVVNNITRNTVFRDGGVAGYADGGVLARMAEAGPELLRFADGGVGLALTDGLYGVPRGTLVTPAPATKQMLSGDPGGGIAIHNSTIYVYPATGDVQREFTNALVGMGA